MPPAESTEAQIWTEDVPPSSIILFYINSFATLMAGNMFNYAMVIQTRALTGSDGFTGLIFMGLYGPTMIFGLWAGKLLDRYRRKNFLYITQFTILFNCLLWVLLIWQGHAIAEQSWLLLMISMVHGTNLAFLIPARFAFIGDLVQAEHTGRVTIVLNILALVAFGTAPVFTGLLKSVFPYKLVYLCIAGGFVLAATFLFPIQSIQRAREITEVSMRAGFLYIIANKLVLELLLIAAVGFYIVGPIQVLFPEFARSILNLDEAGRGSFMAMLGLGLLLGGVLARSLNKIPRRGWMIMVGTLFAGLALGSIAFLEETEPAAALLVAAGIAGGILSTLIPAALQEKTPDEYRGRVMGMFSMIFLALPALSGFAMGMLADSQGLVRAILVSGLVVMSGAVLAALFLKKLRQFE